MVIEGAFHILSVFFFFQVIFLFWQIAQRARQETLGIMMNPFLFIPLAVGIMGASCMLMGLDNFELASLIGAGIALGLVHPTIAVSFFIGNLFMRPWEYMGTNLFMSILPRLLAGETMLSWIIYRIRKGSINIVWNRPVMYFFGFIMWMLFSACLAYNPADSLSSFNASMLPVVVVAFIVLNSVTDPLSVKTLRGSVVLSIAGMVAVAVYLTVSHSIKLDEGNRLTSLGMWSNANDLAALITLAMPLAVVPWMIRSRSFFSFVSCLLLTAIFVAGLLLSQSRGAIMALMIGIAATVLSLSKMNIKTFALLGVGSLIPLALYFGIHRDQSDLEGSSDSRFNYVITGFKMLRSHPIFGVGPDNYPNLFEQYTSDFEEWGKRTAHSTWVIAMSEGGLVGIALFVALYVSTLRRAWRIRRQMPELFLAMITYGVAMTFLSHTYLLSPYLLFALVLGAYRSVQFEEAKPVKVPRTQVVAATALLLLLILSGTDARADSDFELHAVAGGNKPLGDFTPLVHSSLELEGSRGETRNFMLQVGGNGCSDLTVQNFKNEKGAKGAFDLKLFAMKKFHTEHPSYDGAFVGDMFDPLIPLPKFTLCSKSGGQTWIWGELSIPKTASPGTYKGSLEFGEVELPVKVTVWKMQIPEEFALPAYSELTTFYNLLGHYGKWHEGEAVLADKYAKAMIDHRLIPVKSQITMPPVHDKDGKPSIDLLNAPDPVQSFSAVTLKNRPEWAEFDLPTVKHEEIGDVKTALYFQAIENALPTLKRAGKAFFYLWDEPNKQEFPLMRALAGIAKRFAPSVKVMVTTPWRADLDPLVDIYCPIMNAFGPDGNETADEYKKIKESGHQFWWYVSCESNGCTSSNDPGVPDMAIDRPAVYVRSIPWISDVYGAQAFLYYSVNNGYQQYPKRDPWDSLWDFSSNGDGTLFYPGRPGENGQTEHGPIPSIRLKLWREASFDAEYVHWMESLKDKPAWFAESLHEVVTSVSKWDRDYDDYETLRIKIGDYLNSRP